MPGLITVVDLVARIAVVVSRTWPGPPRVEADIEDDPATVDKAAMMSMPPMVTASVPIMMSIGRMPGVNMITPIAREVMRATYVRDTPLGR